jgi:hypothetical protein
MTGIADAALGSLLIRQGKFAEARKVLEKAVLRARTNYLACFNLAYAISREKADANGKVSGFAPEETRTMREALDSAIRLEPRFADSYRLLAFIDFVNGENADEAIALLKKGIALKPEADEFEILLAHVLLTRDRYDEAKSIAASLVKKAADPAVRDDAESILKIVGEYIKARLVIESGSTANVPWTQSLILLKRSWLTKSDLEEIDLNRQINNLNIILEGPRQGEQRIVGVIENVTCTNGEIDYGIKSGGQNLVMSSKDFAGVRMDVLLEGENTVQIDCGVSFAKTLAVVAFRSPAKPLPKAKPELTSISFVPDFFVLKTPEEMTSARTVVVEDDAPRRARTDEGADLKPEARWAAIAEKLRAVQDGESREMGVLEKIDCAGKSVTVIATAAGKRLRLFSKSPENIRLAWFSPKASQIPLVCGASPLAANAVITFRRANTGADGELIALEFVPEGFLLSAKR